MKINKLLISFIFLIFFINVISATLTCSDFNSKNTLCSALNYSSIECDNWWWNNASDCNTNLTMSNYYSKTQIDSLFSEFISVFISNITSFINFSNISMNQSCGNISYISVIDWNENLSLQVRDMIVDYLNYSDETKSNQNDNENKINENQNNNAFFVMVFLVLLLISAVIVLFVMLFNQKTKQKSSFINYPTTDYKRYEQTEKNIDEIAEEDEKKFNQEKEKERKRKR